MSAEEFEAFFEKYEQACYQEGIVVLRLHLSLEAGRVFCFNRAPDADAVRRSFGGAHVMHKSVGC